MTNVARIDWTFITATSPNSGTDSRVSLDIMRDGETIVVVNDEPGNTSRLDRGENATRHWQFRNPDGIGEIISGTAVPYTEKFPQGVRGHLTAKIEIHGDDLWRKARIISRVWSGALRGIPGSIDSVEWVETPETFDFSKEKVLSTDSDEGITSLTLIYG